MPADKIQHQTCRLDKHYIVTKAIASLPPSTSSTSFLRTSCLFVSFSCQLNSVELNGLMEVATQKKHAAPIELPNLVHIGACPAWPD